MNVEAIRNDFVPVHEALKQLSEKEAEIEGVLVLVANKNGGYTYFMGGALMAETTIGRLEVVKRALLRQVP